MIVHLKMCQFVDQHVFDTLTSLRVIFRKEMKKNCIEKYLTFTESTLKNIIPKCSY